LPSLLRARVRDAVATLRDRQLARLMLTWGAWITAEWAFLIVVSVLAFDRGGAAAAGLTFDEIALLKVVPRTASVVSVGSSRLLSIDGDSFVAAVTRHRLAEQRANDAADDLLKGDALTYDDRSSLA